LQLRGPSETNISVKLATLNINS